MADVSPWHSIYSPVYHVRTSCHLGNNIKRENRRQDTGNRQLCDERERLIKDRRR